MINGLRPFRVFNEATKQFMHGRFIITTNGELKKEIPSYDPKFPHIENTFVETIDDDDLKIIWE